MAEFLHIVLSVSLFYTFIAGGACSEDLRFCATVHISPSAYLVPTQHLEWGKWIESYYHTADAEAPTARTSPIKFCTSGREMSPSGTEGRVTVVPLNFGYNSDTNTKFTIEWDRPWSGRSYVREIYDENVYDVEKIKLGPWQYRYNLIYKPLSK
ncbi:unnamed protein product [Parnassius apollo]|uniref:(apollo) hypothetical protein n=1 Tax=Parnassius apollo TaxID=110799 RepID=A0A8S3Y3F2_PARAO|nr:unnamed protein product [Parnassius apollo]